MAHPMKDSNTTIRVDVSIIKEYPLHINVSLCTVLLICVIANISQAQMSTSVKSTCSIGAPPSELWMLVNPARYSRDAWDAISKIDWFWRIISVGDRLVATKQVAYHSMRRTSNLSIGVPDMYPSKRYVATEIIYNRQRYREWEPVWFVMYDGDESGPALWWADEHGKRIKPIINEYVDAFYVINGNTVAIGSKVMLIDTDWGPDVIKISSIDGRIVRHVLQSDGTIMVQTESSIWRVDEDANTTRICRTRGLVGAPRAYLARSNGSFYVLTYRGLWLCDGDKSSKVCDVDTDITFPEQNHTPLYESRDGSIFVGLAYYIIRLIPEESGCKQEWYVPRKCSRTENKNGKCYCSEGELAGKPFESIFGNGP